MDSEEQMLRHWIPTLFAPYSPGISERLRILSAQNGIQNWYSYGGKLQDKLSNFKDKLHESKSQHTVYSLACKCGARYVGESTCNLKIHIHEHTLRSSKSALILHVRELMDSDDATDTEDADHSVLKKSTLVLGQEKNMRKQKFMESICIMAKAPRLYNLGLSVQVSDVWNPNLSAVARTLPDMD